MKIQPLHDRVLIKRLEELEVKRGGIIIPDTAKEKPQEAEIIEVGKGRVLAVLFNSFFEFPPGCAKCLRGKIIRPGSLFPRSGH